MPKKKTGQRKKAEKQRMRQKEIRTAKENVQLAQHPCNSTMECEKCHRYHVFNSLKPPFKQFESTENRKAGRFATFVRACNVYQFARSAAK